MKILIDKTACGTGAVVRNRKPNFAEPVARVMTFSSEFIESTLDSGFHEQWERGHAWYLDRPHTYLASFPRSGNGWVRLVIAAAALNYPTENVSKLEIRYRTMGQGSLCSCLAMGDSECSIQDIFPDIYHFDENQQYRAVTANSVRLPARLIKTHHVCDCQSARALFLFRSPSSCLTSAALYFDRERVAAEPTRINETIGYLAKFYQALMRHFIEQYDRLESNVLFVNHRDLQKDGAREFERIFEFLGMQVSGSSLTAILKRFPFKSSFDGGLQQYFDTQTIDLLRSIEDFEYVAALSRCQPFRRASRAG